MTQKNITTITVSTKSNGKKLYAISFIDLQKNHYLLTGYKSTQGARNALAKFVAENVAGGTEPRLQAAIKSMTKSDTYLGRVSPIGFLMEEQGEVGYVSTIASRLAYDAAAVGAAIKFIDVSEGTAEEEYSFSFHAPSDKEISPVSETVESAPVVEKINPTETVESAPTTEVITGDIVESTPAQDAQPAVSNALTLGIKVTTIITGAEKTASEDRNLYLAHWHHKTQGTGRRYVTSTHYLAAPLAFEVTDTSITPVIITDAVYTSPKLSPITFTQAHGEVLEKAWKRALKQARGVSRAYRAGEIQLAEVISA